MKKSFRVNISGGQVGDISQDTATNMDKSHKTTNNYFFETSSDKVQTAASAGSFKGKTSRVI